MQYLKILAAWLAVFFVPVLLTPYYPSGVAWFLVNATWSMLLVFVLLRIKHSTLSLPLSVIEIIAIIIHLFAAVGFITNYSFFYDEYESLLLLVNSAQFALILVRMPFNDMGQFSNRLWNSIHNSDRVSGYNLRHSKAQL